jgi:hypothetical protein
VENDKPDSHAAAFFKQNPDARDSIPPERKLELLDEKLAGDLDPSERFSTLLQQKAVRYIVYGENSAESLHSHRTIGAFYNANNRPASAIRHLTKAQHLQETNQIDEAERMEIAFELSDSYLSIKTEKKAERSRNITQAQQTIDPYAQSEIADARLRYRRDQILGRLSVATDDFESAVAQFESAVGALNEANGGETKEETAVLYNELADAADALGESQKAGANYRKAYNAFRRLGLDAKADALLPKLSEDAAPEEEDAAAGEGEPVIEVTEKFAEATDGEAPAEEAEDDGSGQEVARDLAHEGQEEENQPEAEEEQNEPDEAEEQQDEAEEQPEETEEESAGEPDAQPREDAEDQTAEEAEEDDQEFEGFE